MNGHLVNSRRNRGWAHWWSRYEPNKAQATQGLMCRCFCDQWKSDVLMPAPHITYVATALFKRQCRSPQKGTLGLSSPNAKSQVTFRHDENGKPCAIWCGCCHAAQQQIDKTSWSSWSGYGRISQTVLSCWNGYHKRTPNILSNPTGTIIYWWRNSGRICGLTGSRKSLLILRRHGTSRRRRFLW